MIDVDIGFCTALSRGLILSMPCSYLMNNLNPFFTPADGVENFSIENLLKIDIQYNVGNGLDDKDVKKLTKQHKTIPNNAVDLIQQVLNLVDSEDPQNLEFSNKITKHRRILFNHYSSLGEAFRFSILHRLHVGNQLFFQSCVQGEIESTDVDAICLNNFMCEVQTGSFQLSHLFQPTKT